jgi:LuxR family quorum-sensing system transcriptional regulator CciR
VLRWRNAKFRLPRLFIDFHDLAVAAESDKALAALFVDVARDMGFEWSAMLHTAALIRRSDWMIRCENYPLGWDKRLVIRGHRVVDPVLMAVRRRECGLLWPEDLSSRPFNGVQRTILEEGCRFGIRQGFTVPVNVPGEPEGSVSFATRSTRRIGRERILLADAIARTAFDQMRRIRGFDRRSDATAPITERERECIFWIAQGRTNEDIAQILAIDVETVRTYIKRAFAKLGRLNSRAQLVYEALRLGLIDTWPSCPPFG